MDSVGEVSGIFMNGLNYAEGTQLRCEKRQGMSKET